MIWLFLERPTYAGAVERLFTRFDATLRNAGYLPMLGQILDAMLVAGPKLKKFHGKAGFCPEGP